MLDVPTCGYRDDMSEESGPVRSAPPLDEIAEELAASLQARSKQCIDLSELSEVVQERDLGDEQAPALQEALEERG